MNALGMKNDLVKYNNIMNQSIIDAEVVEAEIKAEGKKEEEMKSQTYSEMDEYLRKLAR